MISAMRAVKAESAQYGNMKWQQLLNSCCHLTLEYKTFVLSIESSTFAPILSPDGITVSYRSNKNCIEGNGLSVFSLDMKNGTAIFLRYHFNL